MITNAIFVKKGNNMPIICFVCKVITTANVGMIGIKRDDIVLPLKYPLPYHSN